jgi:hypothetical protein
MIKGKKVVDGKQIEVWFSYSESYNNVYKTVKYFIDGRRVNNRNKKEIKELIKDAPDILTQNTYFWRPGTNAKQRRKNEEMQLKDVLRWMEKEGFEILSKEEE